MRDPTRGGLSSTTNEIAAKSRVGITLEERCVAVREEVRGACELLGLDPMYVANEGKLVAIVDPCAADAVLAAMHKHVYGREARIIGTVTESNPGTVADAHGIWHHKDCRYASRRPVAKNLLRR